LTKINSQLRVIVENMNAAIKDFAICREKLRYIPNELIYSIHQEYYTIVSGIINIHREFTKKN